MREMLKNELMLLLDKIMDTETLKAVEPQICKKGIKKMRKNKRKKSREPPLVYERL